MSADLSPASRRTARRERWFGRGASALHRTVPEVPPGHYACPLCLRARKAAEAFTFEDVPPKCLGGRPLILTCPSCNQHAGRNLDHHARAGEDAREFAAGKRPLRATIAVDGADVRVDFWRKPDCNALEVLSDYSSPRNIDALKERFQRAAAAGETDWSMGLSWTERHDPWADYLSWLRAAYLVAFAALGYRYVLQPPLAVVRQQINAPAERLFRQTSAFDPPKDAGFRRLIAARDPTPCIIVQFGGRMLFLPSLFAETDFYERLDAQRAGKTRADFSGQEVAWPTSPIHALDFEPSLIESFVYDAGPAGPAQA